MSINFEPAIVRCCQDEINHLMAIEKNISGVLVCSTDGFEVASQLKPHQSVAKLSAMASSTLALGHAITSEILLGQCKDVIVDSSDGKVLLMSIERHDSALLLVAIADSTETLGQVLWRVKACAAAIAAGGKK